MLKYLFGLFNKENILTVCLVQSKDVNQNQVQIPALLVLILLEQFVGKQLDRKMRVILKYK